jgi:hypothetical protein
MQRTIIAVCGGKNVGKTSSIKIEYKRLEGKAKTIIQNNPRNTKEVFAVLQFKGIRIGFASKGDFAKELKEKLDQLTQKDRCAIIVCACRPERTKTYKEVKRREPRFKVQFIPKQVAQASDHDRANEEKMKEIHKKANEKTAHDIERRITEFVGGANGSNSMR